MRKTLLLGNVMQVWQFTGCSKRYELLVEHLT